MLIGAGALAEDGSSFTVRYVDTCQLFLVRCRCADGTDALIVNVLRGDLRVFPVVDDDVDDLTAFFRVGCDLLVVRQVLRGRHVRALKRLAVSVRVARYFRSPGHMPHGGHLA